MTQVETLVAELRGRVGKGTAHALRRENRIPAVIYGDSKAPLSISLDYNLAARYAGKAGFFTHLFDIELDGKKHRVLPRDAQFDPVSDKVLHIDFLRVAASTKIRVNIPVSFINGEKSPGMKRGGALNIVHHEVEVLCSPDSIPEKFEVSLEGMQIGEAVHLSAIVLPKGAKFTTVEKDFTIASIAVPSGMRSTVDEAATTTATAAAAPAAAAGKAAPAAAAGKAAPAAAKAPAAKPAGKK